MNHVVYTLDRESAMASVRYDSVTFDTWVRAADLNVRRSHLGCAAVADGLAPRIYAIGGGDSDTGEALRSMEVYDVGRDAWRLHDAYLPAGRTRLAVENVDDEVLLLVGGDA